MGSEHCGHLDWPGNHPDCAFCRKQRTAVVQNPDPAVIARMVEEYDRTGYSTCPVCGDPSQPWGGMFVCSTCDWAVNFPALPACAQPEDVA